MVFSPILYPSTLVLFFLLIKIGMGNKKTRTPFSGAGLLERMLYISTQTHLFFCNNLTDVC
ncbi:hypothetical protein D8Z77_12095 [Brevibacillus laterosporus]|nr:hypothetical protein D8Z77_12095 [Brevibacillus laterosporus]